MYAQNCPYGITPHPLICFSLYSIWPPFHVGIVGRRRWTNVTFVYTHSVYFIRYKILEAIGGKYSSELFSFWFC